MLLLRRRIHTYSMVDTDWNSVGQVSFNSDLDEFDVLPLFFQSTIELDI
jgi:hypothetical protein